MPAVLGVLRFGVFFAVMAGLLVLVAVPALASPLLTQMVRDAGLRGDDLRVSVGLFDPTLFTGRAEELRIEGRNVSLGPATAGGVDLTLGEVSFFERTFESVRGNLRDVELVAGGVRVGVARVEISGPAGSADVSGHFTPEQSSAVIHHAAQRAGVTLDGVRFVDGGLRITIAGIEVRAAIAVEGGGLVLRPQAGQAILLLVPAPPDPWRLTEAWVSNDGITVRGVVNAAALAERATASR